MAFCIVPIGKQLTAQCEHGMLKAPLSLFTHRPIALKQTCSRMVHSCCRHADATGSVFPDMKGAHVPTTSLLASKSNTKVVSDLDMSNTKRIRVADLCKLHLEAKMRG